MTQCEQTLQHMKQHGSITPLDAIGFGCLRLSARIYDLRQSGVRIKTKIVTENKKTFGRCSLEQA